jgi:putative FmdB family regulatory protein
MPTYEFYCNECQDPFEAQQRVEDHSREVLPCPKCGSREHVQRQLSTVHVQTQKKTT